MKLKISKTTVIFLAAGVFVLVLATLGMAYTGQQDTQSQLKNDLAMVEARLAKLPSVGLSSQVGELKQEVAKLEAEVKVSETRLVQKDSLGNRKLADIIFAMAESSGVSIIELKMQSPTVKKIEDMKLEGMKSEVKKDEGTDLLALPVWINVEGDVQNIIGFVINMTQRFTPNEVRTVKVDVPRPEQAVGQEQGGEGGEGQQEQEQQGEEQQEQQEGEQQEQQQLPKAIIDMVIYSFRGD